MTTIGVTFSSSASLDGVPSGVSVDSAAPASPSPPVPPSGAEQLNDAVPLVLDLGWTIAALRNPPAHAESSNPWSSVEEPTAQDQTKIQSAVVRALVQRLSAFSLLAVEPTLPQVPSEDLGVLSTLNALDLAFRTTFAAARPELTLSYELGMLLAEVSKVSRSGCSETGPWNRAFDRERVSPIQAKLAILAPHFPDDSAMIVKSSVGRWAAFLDVWTEKPLRGARPDDANAQAPRRYLVDQVGVWRNILLGVEATGALLTPEAYVAAGEAALSRTVRIVRRVIRHYWAALAVVALAGAGVVVFASVELGGAAEAWTQIAAIAGALGISAKGVATVVTRLSQAAERPIYRQAELDAMAWAITTLPDIKMGAWRTRKLRQAGIARTGSLGKA